MVLGGDVMAWGDDVMVWGDEVVVVVIVVVLGGWWVVVGLRVDGSSGWFREQTDLAALFWSFLPSDKILTVVSNFQGQQIK